MKRFLNLPFINITTSAKAWIQLSDLAAYLKVGEHKLRTKLVTSNAAPFRMIRPRTNEIIKSARRGNFNAKGRNAQYFDLDFALAACFSMSHEPARKMRDQVVYILNNLFFDGFVSTKNYHLDVELRRAITAHVCGVDHYYDIVKTRWDSTDQCAGTALAPVEVTPEKLATPDYYLERSEVTAIKAIDLALHLLVEYCTDDADDKVSALNELLDIIGVDRSAGVDDAKNNPSETLRWVHDNHSKLKPLGDDDE